MVYRGFNRLLGAGKAIKGGAAEYFRGFSTTGVSIREEFLKGMRGESTSLNKVYEKNKSIDIHAARKEGVSLYLDTSVAAYALGNSPRVLGRMSRWVGIYFIELLKGSSQIPVDFWKGVRGKPSNYKERGLEIDESGMHSARREARHATNDFGLMAYGIGNLPHVVPRIISNLSTSRVHTANEDLEELPRNNGVGNSGVFMTFGEVLKADEGLGRLLAEIEKSSEVSAEPVNPVAVVPPTRLSARSIAEVPGQQKAHQAGTPKPPPPADMNRYTTLGAAIGPLLLNSNNTIDRRIANDIAREILGMHIATLLDTRDGQPRSYVPNEELSEFRKELAERLPWREKLPPQYRNKQH
ncbi:MAG: hypothetical protein HY361_04935 [Candidatus Aenigmarchaeota archaeon]|nr:hypothetical protein [Candidatus Aenigmarchaeota archaeon]